MFNMFFAANYPFLVTLDILSVMNNNYTLDSLRRVPKQKIDMYNYLTNW